MEGLFYVHEHYHVQCTLSCTVYNRPKTCVRYMQLQYVVQVLLIAESNSSMFCHVLTGVTGSCTDTTDAATAVRST